MVYALHKVCHYLLGNLFIFLVDHTVVVYLVNKPQVSRCIIQWLFLFLEYNLKVIYKPTKSHNVVDALSIFSNQDLKRLKKFTCFNLKNLFIQITQKRLIDFSKQVKGENKLYIYFIYPMY